MLNKSGFSDFLLSYVHVIVFLMATGKLATADPSIVKDRIFASSLAAKMVASELCQVRDFPSLLHYTSCVQKVDLQWGAYEI